MLYNLRLRKNIALILTRNPASIKSTYCTGRSSDLFRLSRLPSFSPVAKRATNSVPQSRNGTHSNRHCSGFTPDSLFTLCDARSRKAPCAMTKLEKFFLGCTVKANIFLGCQFGELPLNRSLQAMKVQISRATIDVFCGKTH